MSPSRYFAVATAALIALPSFAATAPSDACVTRAGRLFDALGERDYDAVAGLMDPQLRANSFPTLLPAMWDSLVKNNYGAYLSHGQATAMHNGDGTTTVSMPLNFERMTTAYRVTCDQGGAVDELVMTP